MEKLTVWMFFAPPMAITSTDQSSSHVGIQTDGRMYCSWISWDGTVPMIRPMLKHVTSRLRSLP